MQRFFDLVILTSILIDNDQIWTLTTSEMEFVILAL